MTEQAQQSPATFGKYQILEELGQGGFGTVYLAHDRYLDIQRAIKILHPVLMTDGTFMESFRKEARFAAKLDHPNLVPVYDFGQEDGRFYLVMKYMQGGSLKEKIAKQGPMSPKKASKIFLQICEGVRFAHSQGIIHRDLKPSNILFEQDDSVRVGDLGFAKAISASKSSTMSKSGSFLGTPEYMAPEIWEGKDASKQSDIYSLGCILYEILTGKILFEGTSPAAIMTKHVIHGPEFDSHLTPSLQTIMKKALASNPTDRYVNVKELEEALKNYIFLQPLLDESQSTSSINEPANTFSENEKVDGQAGTCETGVETEHQEPAIVNMDDKVEKVDENERQTATLGVVEVLLDEILGDIELPEEPSSKDISTWINQLENQHDRAEESIPEGTNEKRPESKKINPAIIKVLFILGLSLLGLFLGYLVIYVNNSKTTTQQPQATTISNQSLPTSTTTLQESTPESAPTITASAVPGSEIKDTPIPTETVLSQKLISQDNIGQLALIDVPFFNEVDQVLFSDDGIFQVNISNEKDLVEVWDIENQKIILETEATRSGWQSILGGDFSSDGQYLALAFQRQIEIWNIWTGELESKYTETRGDIEIVEFAPDSHLLYYIHANGWLRALNFDYSYSPLNSDAQTGDIYGFAISEDGSYLSTMHSSTSYDSVKVWNLESKTLLRVIDLDLNSIDSNLYGRYGKLIRYLPDNKTIIVGSDDGTVYKFDSLSGERLASFWNEEYFFVKDLIVSPDLSLIAVSYMHRKVVFLDLNTFSELNTIQTDGENYWIHDIQFSPDGKWLITDAKYLGVWGIP